MPILTGEKLDALRKQFPNLKGIKLLCVSCPDCNKQTLQFKKIKHKSIIAAADCLNPDCDTIVYIDGDTD